MVEDEDLKQRVFKRLYNSVPKAIWVICASYMAIVLSTVFALLIARIDADEHINRYMDILLKREEAKTPQALNCNHDELIERLNQLELYSHKPKANKSK